MELANRWPSLLRYVVFCYNLCQNLLNVQSNCMKTFTFNLKTDKYKLVKVKMW